MSPYQPVETAAGEQVRQLGLRALSESKRRLLHKSTRRPLTLDETRELRAADDALDELRLMAPQGPLLGRHEEPSTHGHASGRDSDRPNG